YTVDPRFADKDFRNSQNYVGESIAYTQEKLHYIPPKPEDVAWLMEGLFQCYFRMVDSQINPVLIATVISFGFVFIHPFEDGNGRLHRFLIHHILSRLKMTPEGLIFPISATMLNHLREYDQCLESYSVPLMDLLEDYDLSPEGKLTIQDNKSEYYSYIDFTEIGRYLFRCVEKTIQNDFRNQLEYLISYDQTKKEIQEIVDMPDQRIDLIIRLILDNQGTLSKTKKGNFSPPLTSKEIQSIEKSIQKQMLSKNFSRK
ncbi:MAG: Fic family protein, partial [Planctomycetota bacterium]